MPQKNFHSSIDTNALLHLSAHYDYSFECQSCCSCSSWCSYFCIQQLQVLEGQHRSQWCAVLAIACCQVLHACFLHFIFIFVFKENWCSSQENLINMKDPVLLMHQLMHNILFLVRNEYNALTKATPGMVTLLGYQAVTNFCCEVQVACGASSSTPVPITAQDKALADIAEVMAEVKAKACLFHPCIFFLLY